MSAGCVCVCWVMQGSVLAVQACMVWVRGHRRSCPQAGVLLLEVLPLVTRAVACGMFRKFVETANYENTVLGFQKNILCTKIIVSL